MNKTRIIFMEILFLMLCGCAPKEEIVITNLKHGLMAQNKEGLWYVYRETRDLRYQQNGECTVAKQKITVHVFRSYI